MAVVALFSFLRLAGYLTGPLLSDRDIHQIVGEPSRIGAVADPRSEMKVVTWNIERGVEFDRILSTLQTLDADILLLQEVDRFCRRTGGRDIAKELAEALGMNWLSAGEFQEIGESRGRRPALTGQAVLSKYPIEDAGVLHFAAQAKLRWRLSPLQPCRGGQIALKVRTVGLLVCGPKSSVARSPSPNRSAPPASSIRNCSGLKPTRLEASLRRWSVSSRSTRG